MRIRNTIFSFNTLLILLFLQPCFASCNNTDTSGTVQPQRDSSVLTNQYQVGKIRLPEGFKIAVYAEVPGARSLTRSPSGIVFAGSRGTGKVYALVDENKDGKNDKVYVLAKGLNSPNGVAFKDGSLYIATISSILRVDSVEKRLANPMKPVVVYNKFPTAEHHGWKFIAFGPDGKLYVPVGAPCNVCLEDNPVYASITRMNANGTGVEVFASGVRNTVGFDWNPLNGQLWFTDNGRDNLGNDVPADELNAASKAGLHFGFPFCHQGDIADPDFGDGRYCSEFTAPVQKLGPHVAALGMRFYTGNMFPAGYKNQVFIAEHGSWNRTEPIGYRLSLVKQDAAGKVISYSVFADGWLQPGGKVLGRPVDVLVMPDGALLLSDDYSGVVYRISYQR